MNKTAVKNVAALEQLLLQRLEQPNLSRAEKTATNKRLEEVRARQRELIDYDKLLADYANQRSTWTWTTASWPITPSCSPSWQPSNNLSSNIVR